MGNDFKTSVERLISDGSNWVTYRDRMIWSLRSRRLLDHLASSTIPAAYINAGDINNQTPQMQWESEEAITMQIIAVSIPNPVFTNVKNHMICGVWLLILLHLCMLQVWSTRQGGPTAYET